MLVRLLRYLAGESRLLLVIGTGTAVVQSVLLVPIALIVRDLFDTWIPHRRTGSIVIGGIAILALYAAGALLGYIARVAALRTTTGVSRRMRLDVLAKLYELPQRWHDRQRAGEVHSLAVRDPERIETMLAHVAGAVVPAAVVGLVLLIVALIINPTLFLTGLITVPLLMVGTRLLARRVRGLARLWSKSSREFSAQTQLQLRAMLTSRVHGAEPWELDRVAAGATEAAERYRAMGVALAALHSVQNAVSAAAGTAVLVVGGLAVAHHAMTLGSLLAFYAVLALLLRQLHTLGYQTDAVVIGWRSLQDVEALLALEEAQPYREGRREIDFRGGLCVEQVSFAYDDRPVLKAVSFSIAPGEHVTLVGPNGAGKSTLVNLLLGLYEPEQGGLRADGIPYEQLDLGALRRQIGVVIQDPVLLPGTVRENIAYAKPHASEAEVRAAAETATAAEFIETQPDGYQTRIGDEGTGLSGGQRQRIAVARALLGDPALLILDEPTTYLDEASVSALMARLMALPHAPTVLLVTHDPNVATHGDRVIELRDGHVVADRRHPVDGDRIGVVSAGPPP